MSEKKTKIRIQVKDFKLRFFKNLFLRFKSKYFCCSLQNKIYNKKQASPKRLNFTCLKSAKSPLFDWIAPRKF